MPQIVQCAPRGVCFVIGEPCVPKVSYQFKAPVTPLSHDESRVYTKDDLEELEWEIRLDSNKCS